MASAKKPKGTPPPMPQVFPWTTVAERHKEDEDGITVTILDANGEAYVCPTPNGGTVPFTITLAGPTSKAARTARAVNVAQQTKYLRVGAGKGGDLEITIDSPKDDFEALAVFGEQQVELYARRVLSWTLATGSNGTTTPVPCNMENVKTLLVSAPEILQQLREADEKREATFRLGHATRRAIRDVGGVDAQDDAGRGDVSRTPTGSGQTSAHQRRSARHGTPHTPAHA